MLKHRETQNQVSQNITEDSKAKNRKMELISKKGNKKRGKRKEKLFKTKN